MKKTSLSSVLMIALAGTLALAGCKKKEETTPPPMTNTPAPAPMSEPAPAPAPAVNVTAVTVGTMAAADKSVTPVAMIGSKDKIIVSVKTDGTANNATLAAKLTYQDGQVAGEQSATLNTSGTDTTNLEFSKASAWPAGKYRADVTLDGQPVGTTQEFEVK
ncbi:hypothetical protein CQ393_06075 [Stenotrophomonas sp. MYb238]|uniref:hypothetical protein n=1 Tax=Stenotrophomonas sp. MYb238 TaxID=2040281 RepID=UPI0012925659|nr:hypothetical protein [Stenotrophomonas sp. MYb238]MQP75457.1 hypothetical protein [Stenotrophomonas sp. MYb238]